MKQTLKFEVELDENNLPNSIKMLEEKASNSSIDLKALMIAGWDAKRKETLRVDIWTKDMPVNDMFIMYHQNMMGMATSLEKSTGQNKLANALRDYCDFFAKETKILG
ncbi:gliding motility protein GldC [bacterium]|nr:gliding motility protein GldC [bacterium]|tara:strand:+ start:265 stop:588 length:324 start_codon:yes stop_codon:yes gene_type:complete